MGTLLYNGEGWFRDAALLREIALHLTYLLFAQFPLRATVHLGSGCSLPVLLGGRPHEIIANPALPSPKSDEAKRPCALFKISNEQNHVPVAASHYETRQTYIRLLFTQLTVQKRKKKKKSLCSQTKVVSAKKGLFGYCALQHDYSIDDKEKCSTMISFDSATSNQSITRRMIGF